MLTESLERVTYLTREERERVSQRYGTDALAYKNAVSDNLLRMFGQSPAFASFMDAVSRICPHGAVTLAYNIWTVMELEHEEGNDRLLRQIAAMQPCRADQLRRFVGDSDKPLARCVEYLELLFDT